MPPWAGVKALFQTKSPSALVAASDESQTQFKATGDVKHLNEAIASSKAIIQHPKATERQRLAAIGKVQSLKELNKGLQQKSQRSPVKTNRQRTTPRNRESNTRPGREPSRR